MLVASYNEFEESQTEAVRPGGAPIFGNLNGKYYVRQEQVVTIREGKLVSGVKMELKWNGNVPQEYVDQVSILIIVFELFPHITVISTINK